MDGTYELFRSWLTVYAAYALPRLLPIPWLDMKLLKRLADITYVSDRRICSDGNLVLGKLKLTCSVKAMARERNPWPNRTRFTFTAEALNA